MQRNTSADSIFGPPKRLSTETEVPIEALFEHTGNTTRPQEKVTAFKHVAEQDEDDGDLLPPIYYLDSYAEFPENAYKPDDLLVEYPPPNLWQLCSQRNLRGSGKPVPSLTSTRTLLPLTLGCGTTPIASSAPRILTVPYDIIYQVTEYLPIDALAKLALTSRALNPTITPLLYKRGAIERKKRLQTHMHRCAKDGNLIALHRLYLHGANLHACDGKDVTILEYALKHGQWKVVHYLLHERGLRAQPNALINAARDNVPCEVLQILLRAGDVDVMEQDVGGFTALHLAAMYGNVGNMLLLLANGADCEFKADYSRRVVEVAGSPAAVALLVRWGAEVDCSTVEHIVNQCLGKGGLKKLVEQLRTISKFPGRGVAIGGAGVSDG